MAFLRDVFVLGPRVALCVFPFHRWSPLAWLLVASPLLRWAMGPRPGESRWRGWFRWPVEVPPVVELDPSVFDD